MKFLPNSNKKNHSPGENAVISNHHNNFHDIPDLNNATADAKQQRMSRSGSSVSLNHNRTKMRELSDWAHDGGRPMASMSMLETTKGTGESNTANERRRSVVSADSLNHNRPKLQRQLSEWENQHTRQRAKSYRIVHEHLQGT